VGNVENLAGNMEDNGNNEIKDKSVNIININVNNQNQ
jgi:hypothetical protein